MFLGVCTGPPGNSAQRLGCYQTIYGPRRKFIKAQVAVFPAARELWRFVVSATLHTIWVERLRCMEY